MPAKRSSAKPTGAAKRPSGAAGLADKLVKLGIAREEDLVLHLPLRYEDHTKVRAARARCNAGETVQTEGIVVNTDIQYRPRRQLVCLLEDESTAKADGGSSCCASSRSIRASRRRSQRGNRVRVFGDVRDGYFGLEIVHPQFKVVAPGAPLPDRLTPVYPTTAGLGQDTLRKVIARAIAADPARTAETLPEELVRRQQAVEVRRRGPLPARAAAAAVGRRRNRRSTRARIRRGRASSSTSSSRSSSR